MSIGMHIAFGVYAIATGTAGFEHYIAAGNLGGSAFDALLSIVGIAVLGTGINRFRPPSTPQAETGEGETQ